MTFTPQYDNTQAMQQLQLQLQAVQRRDPAVLAKLNAADSGELAGMSVEDQCSFLVTQLQASIRFLHDEPQTPEEIFHSRDPIGGMMQSLMNDQLLTQLQATGEGNPIVWIPAGIDAILEKVRGKYPFQTATPARSQIRMPAQVKIALLADWGADNLHAKRIGDLAIAQGAEYVIHLGDIYYSGAQSECEAFVRNWPLKGDDGNPIVGKSFALNGNHEMYSVGNYYFTTVLGAFQQEASYFTLSNDWWQLQGLDTAYVPFTIDGGGQDDRLQAQWDWVTASIDANPTKKNIFLSHNQPVSSHLPELEAAQVLNMQWWKMATGRKDTLAFAWFFGHEHRCTLYDDTQTNFKARLIGSGAIPHVPQTETEAAVAANGAKATPVWRVNHGVVAGGDTAISTFAMLTFDQDQCTAEYFNEDGSLFYKENLSGGPNSSLDGL
jgi:predicted phosphodiesterase